LTNAPDSTRYSYFPLDFPGEASLTIPAEGWEAPGFETEVGPGGETYRLILEVPAPLEVVRSFIGHDDQGWEVIDRGPGRPVEFYSPDGRLENGDAQVILDPASSTSTRYSLLVTF